MDETPEIPEIPESSPSFHENDLSAEDIAILRDFDAMEDIFLDESALDVETKLSNVVETATQGEYEEVSPEDLLLLFISEVEEDVRVLRDGVEQLERGETLDVVLLQLLGRKAHKIKGTAGTFGSNVLVSIARYTEALIHLLEHGSLRPRPGLEMLMLALSALEATLTSLVTMGEESSVPLEELEADFKARKMNISGGTLNYVPAEGPIDVGKLGDVPLSERVDVAMAHFEQLLLEGEQVSDPPSVRVEMARLEQLTLHTEQLSDLQMFTNSAQQQVDVSFQELQSAQERLMRLESLSAWGTMNWGVALSDSSFERRLDADERAASSMIASIVDEAQVRLGRNYERKGRRQTRRFSMRQPLYWDELEIDGYAESDTLKNRLSEAIADVATATAQLRTAFAQLNNLLQKRMALVQSVRGDTLSLRLSPLRALLTRIERVVTMNDRVQSGHIDFEVRGETVEVDQYILEKLKTPLLQLARCCVAPDLPSEEPRGRMWCYAEAIENEVAIEIGTSLLVESGVVDEVQGAIGRLHGSIFVRRNAVGGMSFHVRLPRCWGAIHSAPTWGVLVQAGGQRVMVPFAQIERIEYGEVEDGSAVFSLSNLLGLPGEVLPSEERRPLLVLHPGSKQLRVQIDAVIGEVEQVIRPLAPFLRSPGVIGSVIDNMGHRKNVGDAGDGGNVLLVVHLAELIRYAAGREGEGVMHGGEVREGPGRYELRPCRDPQKVVLVVDDSISMRTSLMQSLSASGYRAVGVSDGMEALEYLLDHALPHVLLLDVEMPHLNGYDLLSIIRSHEQLSTVKIVMLTSRSSEKHERRALELGAQAYLTKPCPHDVLLRTIESLPE